MKNKRTFTVKEIGEAKFVISNLETFAGDFEMQKFFTKIIERRAAIEAGWIDGQIKRLLPEYVVKITPKLHKNPIFRFLIRIIFDINIVIMSEPSKNIRIVSISRKGKEVASKTFT